MRLANKSKKHNSRAVKAKLEMRSRLVRQNQNARQNASKTKPEA